MRKDEEMNRFMAMSPKHRECEKRKAKREKWPLFYFRFSLFRSGAAPLRLCGKAVWQFLREVSGENDYGRYRTRMLAIGERPLSAEDFYVEKLRRIYSRPNRCC